VIGQVLGHCRVVAKIGEGGMGAVYRAYDEVLHRDVAVKVLKKEPVLDSSGRHKLLQEARASSSLAHPNICTIHDVGEIDGDLYIVMELVEGKSLHALAGISDYLRKPCCATACRLRVPCLALTTGASCTEI
jgi:serine/threonine protein kinase